MRTLILTGHRDVGKTRLGRELARRLALPFRDTDQLIEERTGRSRRALFRHPPLFRALERQVIGELPSELQVIALGGGSLLDPRNLAPLKPLGLLVFLERAGASRTDYVARLPHYRRLADATASSLDELLQLALE